jgi:hypothetical protein
VVGYADDLHARAVVDRLQARGGSVVMLDAERLARSAVVAGEGGVNIESDELSAASRGWMRRLAPEDWREGADPSSHIGVVQSAWILALLSVAALVDVEWLSQIEAIYAAEDKLVQQRACRRLGIEAPPAVLTTRRELIPPELGDELVVKPLAAGHFHDEKGSARVVHATAMSRDDERLAHLAGAPFLVQRRVEGRTHLRVVTVRERAWVASLPAASYPLDWRSSDEAHSMWAVASDDDATRAAVALASELGVGYSSQDWIVDGQGRAHFLDLNPAGQWLFLPEELAALVTDTIADWLLGVMPS